MVQRVSPGQPIPNNWPKANDWNAIGEATEFHQRHHRTRDAAQHKQWIIPTDWFFAENSTGDRRAGEVLEAGDYLLDEVDPFAPWFEGVAPTSPVHESTHGVLRVACKDGDFERVQCSGIVRALVNVTEEAHNFCNAETGLFVLQSAGVGPHKIVWKPDGTGEKECFVLLYVGEEELIAEALLAEDLCPQNSDGTGSGLGTGGQAQEVQVTDARIMPYCIEFTPPRVVNPKNHSGPAGSMVSMHKRICEGQEEWVIDDVELREFCAVAGIENRPSCLVAWGLPIWSEWCPTREPLEACIVVEYTTCSEPLPECDVTLVFDPLYACCGFPDGSGTGSGT